MDVGILSNHLKSCVYLFLRYLFILLLYFRIMISHNNYLMQLTQFVHDLKGNDLLGIIEGTKLCLSTHLSASSNKKCPFVGIGSSPIREEFVP
jgi:hypothetical protein